MLARKIVEATYSTGTIIFKAYMEMVRVHVRRQLGIHNRGHIYVSGVKV